MAYFVVPTAAHVCYQMGSLMVYIMVPNVACIGPQMGPLTAVIQPCPSLLVVEVAAAASLAHLGAFTTAAAVVAVAAAGACFSLCSLPWAPMLQALQWWLPQPHLRVRHWRSPQWGLVHHPRLHPMMLHLGCMCQ
jgi:hypothetical protein